jgi:RHS repeat-associated protein
MKQFIYFLSLLLFFSTTALSQRYNILGNLLVIEGATETYTLDNGGTPPPAGAQLQWVITNGVKLSENTNPVAGPITVTVKWNFLVSTGRVLLRELITNVQGFKDVQVTAYYNAANFCNEITPVSQNMTWSQPGYGFAARNCNRDPAAPYTIIFQWQQADMGLDAIDILPPPPINWSNITGATQEIYNPPAQFDYGVKLYRRLMFIYSQPGGQLLGTIITNAAECRLNYLQPGVIFDAGWPANNTVTVTQAYNSSLQVLAGNDASGGLCSSYNYVWEKSLEGGPWQEVGVGAACPLNFTNITHGNFKLRRKVVCGLEEKFTNTLSYNITYTLPNDENRNYMRQHIVTKPGVKDLLTVQLLPTGDKFTSTVYSDGLGRTIQTVSKEVTNMNGTWGDAVAYTEYNALGQADKSFMPYATLTNVGGFKTTAAQEQDAFNKARYSEPATAPMYAQAFYEASPLGRQLNAKPAGAAWGGNAAYTGNPVAYELNGADEDVKIFTVDVSPGSLPQLQGVYTSGKLYKTVNTDDRGKKTIIYTDYNGNTILTKVQLSDAPGLTYDGWVCTYNVYDILGRQRYTITPEAVKLLPGLNWNITANADMIKGLCFYTHYDNRGRPIMSHRPGMENKTNNTSGEVHTVYDRRDRVVLSQDENQRRKNQWAYMLYDELNRPVVNGLLNNTASRAALQTQVDALNNGNMAVQVFAGANEVVQVHNPVAGNSLVCAACSNMVANNITYYDNYNVAGALAFDANYSFPAAAAGTYPVNSELSTRTAGKVTGGKTRLLDENYDDGNIFNDRFLRSTVYYNEKGMAFESLAENIKGGVDVGITQYDYSGLVLAAVSKHRVPGTAYSDYTITSRNDYDRAGKLTDSYIQYGSNPFKQLSHIDYDEMGQVKAKTIAPGFASNGNPYLEKQDYSYNIQGWLTGINKDYASQPNYTSSQWGRYFGMQLQYNDNANGPRYNGQLAGVVWKTQGDNVQRKYDYSYDNLGRFVAAAFTQKENPGENWNNAKYNFSVAGISYDYNSNILSMQQSGAKPGATGGVVIDQLQYVYAPRSNQLLKVSDAATGLQGNNGKLGDFADGPNGTADDYVYDDNGNLLADRNKKIQTAAGPGIVWNYLNKPQKITLEGKSVVEFIYDAGGGKIAKKVTSSLTAQVKTTWYVSGLVFEETSAAPGSLSLKMMLHGGGRLRIITPSSMPPTPDDYRGAVVGGGISLPENNKQGVFDYFIQDHLGSTRMVLTEEQHVEKNSCSMETTNSQQKIYEEGNFGQIDANGQPITNVNEVLTSRKQHAPLWPGNPSTYSAKLGGPGGNSIPKVGPNMLLKVMAGDNLAMGVKYFYQGNANTPAGSGLAQQLGTIIQQLLLNGANGQGGLKSFSGDVGGGISNGSSAVNSFLNNQNPVVSNVPNAWLTWLFFDENFNLVSSSMGTGGLRVAAPGSPGAAVDKTLAGNVTVPRNGYVLVYVSNENADVPVFFDDLSIVHTRGRITEENHYYAYGQKISGIGGRSMGKLDNKYKYQGAYAEEEEETGWNEFDLRMYDPQTGRWTGADPYDEFASPYLGMGADPVNNFDEDGGRVTPPDWYASRNNDGSVALIQRKGLTSDTYTNEMGVVMDRVATDNESEETAMQAANLRFSSHTNLPYLNMATILGVIKTWASYPKRPSAFIYDQYQISLFDKNKGMETGPGQPAFSPEKPCASCATQEQLEIQMAYDKEMKARSTLDPVASSVGFSLAQNITAPYFQGKDVIFGLAEGDYWRAGGGALGLGLTFAGIRGTPGIFKVPRAVAMEIEVAETAIGAKGGVDIVGTKFNNVLPTQDYINPLKVAEYKTLIQNGVRVPASEAYQVGGKIFLEEGHHRFVANMLLGIKPPLIIRNTGGPVGFPNWLNTTYQIPPLGH